MITIRVLASSLATILAATLGHAGAPSDESPSLTEKLNAYVGCINRLSERSYESRARYFSWAAKNGPTGKERIIYGTYTIYDTSDCKKNVDEGQCAGAARRGAGGRSLGLRRGRRSARTAAEGGRRLLRAGELQGRQDGQGQGAASAPRRRPGMRSPPPTRSCATASTSSRTSAPRRQLAEIERSEGRKETLPHRVADDPGQARACARKAQKSPTSPRSRRP